MAHRLWFWRRRTDKFKHLLVQGEMIMAAIDDLKAAVDNAVAEMSAAADFIRNHPSNDPTLADFASRLQTAANALHEVDRDPAPVPPPSA